MSDKANYTAHVSFGSFTHLPLEKYLPQLEADSFALTQEGIPFCFVIENPGDAPWSATLYFMTEHLFKIVESDLYTDSQYLRKLEDSEEVTN